MILGRKDKEHVRALEEENDILRYNQDHDAVNFLNYLHDELGITYAKISSTLGVSQQYINSICIRKTKVRNESLYKIMAKLFKKD